MDNKEIRIVVEGILRQAERRKEGSVTKLHLMHDLDIIERKAIRILEDLKKEK
jgi:hypothetical protein